MDKNAVYDRDLQVEVYHFQGFAQPFPIHFHPYYVLGLVESGRRRLSHKYQDYDIQPGDLLLFNPGDSHACAQSGEEPLDYRSITLSMETMLPLSEEITGKPLLPIFSGPVVRDSGDLACQFRALHELILDRAGRFEKEEALLLFLSRLWEICGQPFDRALPECRAEIDAACAFMDRHFGERISLDQLCRQVSLSRSTLLRVFTKAKGITPYRYLETVRVNAAKRLLEQGVPPLDAALGTGFSDQSHFTNYFTRFIGLSPGAYRDIFKHETGGPTHGTTGE